MPEEYEVQDDQKLSIESVLNETTDPGDVSILYASKIDPAAAEQTIDDFIANVKSSVDSATVKIDEIEGILAATQSNSFYSGADAQKNIENMMAAKNNLEYIVTLGNSIDKEGIMSIINLYNEKLSVLKKKCRLKYLQKAADAYNEGRHVLSNEIKQSQLTSAPTKEGDNYHEKGFVQSHIDIIERKVEYTQGQKSAGGYVKYREIKYDYINYWCWLTGDSWIEKLLDDSVEDIERKFKDRNLELPYDVNKLVDC